MAELLIGNIKGEKGDTGNGLTIKDFYDTMDELPSNPSAGDAYGVKNADGDYEIHIYSPSKGWVNNGALQPDINHQAPNYEEAKELETLSSGEKISIAFGKIKKAITDFISHKGDNTKHITSDERTSWNNKAPSGHGLGTLSIGETGDTFNGTLKKGGGFYRVSSEEDAPDNLPYWFSVFQNLRGLQTDSQPTGVQLSVLDYFDYESGSPRMWLRTASQGKLSEWVEMIHTDNIANYCSKIKKGSYVGAGAYSLVNDHYKKISVDFVPKLMIISRKVGDKYAETNIVHFPTNYYDGAYCDIKILNDYTYARTLFAYDETNKEITIYNKSGVVYRDKVDLSTGYIADRVEYDFKNKPEEKTYGNHSLLDGEGETYDYIIFG